MSYDFYYKLFENCVPVKGYNRSIIYDLIRMSYSFIPNELYDMLHKYSNKKVSFIIKYFGKENEKVVSEYFDFLISNEYIFKCNKSDLKLFPKVDMSFHNPYLISNVIIEIDEKTNFNYNDIFFQLDSLGNIDLQLRFLKNVNLDDICSILVETKNRRIKYIEIFLPFFEVSDDNLLKLLNDYLPLSKIVFFNSKDHNKMINCEVSRFAKIVYTNKDLRLDDLCGRVNQSNFIVNMNFFCESYSYNNCLNKKLCIDKNGYIKNCLNLSYSFGNIKNNKLINIVSNNSFQYLWGINKTKIYVCKDCEFRFMCLDCRAFIEDSLDIYSKPKYCKYNPYNNKLNHNE